MDPLALVRANTHVITPELCPELRLRVAADPVDIWLELESHVKEQLGPPFWAHAWPGGLALARFLLDEPERVRGKRVLDFASGCGVGAVAAARSGASSVLATEIDPFAVAAISLNAELNRTAVSAVRRDVIGEPREWDVVLVGDVFYERELTDRVTGWISALSAAGAEVLIGDPGRSFLPLSKLQRLASYPSERNSAWDSCDSNEAVVFRFT
ncbi:MAG: class I SAM-dependent methyltransferase [Myxococcaceae bacterium]